MPVSHVRKAWDHVVFIALIFIAVSVIAEIFILRLIEITPEHLQLLEQVDKFAIFVLFVDLIARFALAKDRHNFLKDNALLVVSFIPYLAFFRVFRFMVILKEFGSIAKLLKLAMHSEFLHKYAVKIPLVSGIIENGKTNSPKEHAHKVSENTLVMGDK